MDALNREWKACLEREPRWFPSRNYIIIIIIIIIISLVNFTSGRTMDWHVTRLGKLEMHV
jgi:hypothetical protein